MGPENEIQFDRAEIGIPQPDGTTEWHDITTPVTFTPGMVEQIGETLQPTVHPNPDPYAVPFMNRAQRRATARGLRR